VHVYLLMVVECLHTYCDVEFVVLSNAGIPSNCVPLEFKLILGKNASFQKDFHNEFHRMQEIQVHM
jgi:hypothetical protein